MILLIGLAVGVDYSLFYLKREREERAAGAASRAALEAAAATSGRSVLISGLTVMIAMAGMFFAGDQAFSSFALATIIVVAIAMLGSLTVLPALLSKLGDRVEKGRVPFLHRLQARRRAEPRLGLDPRPRARRPVVRSPRRRRARRARRSRRSGCRRPEPARGLPQNLKTVKTYNRIRPRSRGELDAGDVVVKADDVTQPAVQAAIADSEARGARKR